MRSAAPSSGDADADTDAADAAAVALMLAVRPAWTGLLPARDALPTLPERGLLHAGPPLRLPGAAAGSLPAPLLHSAIVAVLFEGWAQSEEAARRLVLDGGVELQAAQDYRVVTPLACVVSPSMQLQVVQHLEPGAPSAPPLLPPSAQAPPAAFSPLQGGPPPAPRFGSLHDLGAHVRKLRRLHGPLAAALHAALRAAGPVQLLPLAAASLAAGEECHAATGAASATLRELLLPAPALQRGGVRAEGAKAGMTAESASSTSRGEGRGATVGRCRPLGAAGADAGRDAAAAAAAEEEKEEAEDVGGEEDAAGAAAFLASAPSFFLNLWMAACKRVLMAGEGVPRSTLLTAVGANGLTVGLQLSGCPGVWHEAPAAAPSPYVLAPPVGGTPVVRGAGDGGEVGEQGRGVAVVQPCPAMGDSMVVDALGFGACLQPLLPLQLGGGGVGAAEQEPLGLADHPAFAGGFAPAAQAAVEAGGGPACPRPVRVGISAARAVRRAAAGGLGGRVAINLSVLDAAGVLGIVGRGVYVLPLPLLERAVGDRPGQ